MYVFMCALVQMAIDERGPVNVIDTGINRQVA